MALHALGRNLGKGHGHLSYAVGNKVKSKAFRSFKGQRTQVELDLALLGTTIKEAKICQQPALVFGPNPVPPWTTLPWHLASCIPLFVKRVIPGDPSSCCLRAFAVTFL